MADLGLVLELVLADCDSFLVLVVDGFVGLKGTGLEMDWIRIIRYILR